jgi:tubulin alpha
LPSEKTIGGHEDSFNTVFSDSCAGKHVRRCVFFKPTNIDEVHTGSLTQFFPIEQLSSGKDNVSKNFTGKDGLE